MVVIPDRASRRNDFRIIQLARPGSSVRSIATASTSSAAITAGSSGIVERRSASSQSSSASNGRGAMNGVVNRAEQELLRTILQKWRGAR